EGRLRQRGVGTHPTAHVDELEGHLARERVGVLLAVELHSRDAIALFVDQRLIRRRHHAFPSSGCSTSQSRRSCLATLARYGATQDIAWGNSNVRARGCVTVRTNMTSDRRRH